MGLLKRLSLQFTLGKKKKGFTEAGWLARLMQCRIVMTSGILAQQSQIQCKHFDLNRTMNEKNTHTMPLGIIVMI